MEYQALKSPVSDVAGFRVPAIQIINVKNTFGTNSIWDQQCQVRLHTTLHKLHIRNWGAGSRQSSDAEISGKQLQQRYPESFPRLLGTLRLSR